MRDPDRAEGPLRRRREAAHRVEPGARRDSRALVRRLDASRGGGDGPPRPPPHARVRLRRDDRPGRQPLVARALGGWLERRLERGARLAPGARDDRHRHSGLAPHPVGGVRHVDRSSRPEGCSRSGGSCRLRRASTTRARWPHGLRDCEPLLAALGGVPSRRREREHTPALGAVSPRIADLDPDVADGLERALAALPGERVEPPPPARPARRAWRVLRHGAHRDARLPSPFRGPVERLPLLQPRPPRARRGAGDDGGGVLRRAGAAGRRTPPPGATGSTEHRMDAVVEPTIPIVAPVRGHRLRGSVRPTSTICRSPTTGTGRGSLSSAALRRRAGAAGCR